MSIAILAKKSRAQRGASTRTGWTLATTKSGKCPGPCGGGAPAKQKSFRLLMKNKQQGGGPNPGGMQSKECCKTTYKEVIKPDGDQSASGYTWKKKQLTHDCIQHCIPGREHYNEHHIYVAASGTTGGAIAPGGPINLWHLSGTYTYAGTDGLHTWNGPTWTQGFGPGYHVQAVVGLLAGGLVWVCVVNYVDYPGDPPVHCFSSLADPSAPFPHAPPESGWVVAPSMSGEMSISYGYLGEQCIQGSCNNTGCKCNCNKSLGGTSCCNVHKDMPPISISENIPWVVEARTCHKHWNIKPPPKNNSC